MMSKRNTDQKLINHNINNYKPFNIQTNEQEKPHNFSMLQCNTRGLTNYNLSSNDDEMNAIYSTPFAIKPDITCLQESRVH